MPKEATIRAELYRIISNVIQWGIQGQNYKAVSVAVEYPIKGKRADLVVFFKYSPTTQTYRQYGPDPFLVIETKSRFKYPSKPLGKATEQVMNYAKNVSARFFAVYDGWIFLLFENTRPYLIKLSNFHRMDESIGRNLLVGLLEYYEKGRSEFKTLNYLPKVADGWSFWETILPAVTKSVESITRPEVPEAWKRLKSQWLAIIKRDGEW
jgi:hypothetical protein